MAAKVKLKMALSANRQNTTKKFMKGEPSSCPFWMKEKAMINRQAEHPRVPN